jgi:hypothetical protein
LAGAAEILGFCPDWRRATTSATPRKSLGGFFAPRPWRWQAFDQVDDGAIPRPGRRLLELLGDQLAQVGRQLLRRGLLAHLRQDLLQLLIGDQHLEQIARVALEHLLIGDHLADPVLGELGLEVVDKLARRHRVQFDPLVAQERKGGFNKRLPARVLFKFLPRFL